MLALERFTGRPENAICQLRAADVRLTRDPVLRALAATVRKVVQSSAAGHTPDSPPRASAHTASA